MRVAAVIVGTRKLGWVLKQNERIEIAMKNTLIVATNCNSEYVKYDVHVDIPWLLAKSRARRTAPKSVASIASNDWSDRAKIAPPIQTFSSDFQSSAADPHPFDNPCRVCPTQQAFPAYRLNKIFILLL